MTQRGYAAAERFAARSQSERSKLDVRAQDRIRRPLPGNSAIVPSTSGPERPIPKKVAGGQLAVHKEGVVVAARVDVRLERLVAAGGCRA